MLVLHAGVLYRTSSIGWLLALSGREDSPKAAAPLALQVRTLPAPPEAMPSRAEHSDLRDLGSRKPHSVPVDLGNSIHPMGPTDRVLSHAVMPTFAARPMESVTLHYGLTRGSRQGEATLQWQVESVDKLGAPGVSSESPRYELTLHHVLPGQDSWGWASQGRLDAVGTAGLVPQRFVDRRRGRDRAAINFDRERGEISFSGPTDRHPWVPGVQDRLSWLVQLGAILEADPSRFVAGSVIPMWVATVRGDLEPWTFVVQAPTAAAMPGWVHLVREPLRTYDHRIELWLDAHRHHVPARIVFTPVPAAEPTELVLRP